LSTSIPISTLEKFTTFGDLLRFLRRRAGITQMELAIATGYSDAQISRLEQNLRSPDTPTIGARFVSALGLEDEPKVVARLLELAATTRPQSKLATIGMLSPSLPTGTVVFLFSDMVNFSPRWERDPDATLELLARHDRLLHSLMIEYGGKVFNVRGDNFQVAFTDPLKAVEAALHAQHLVASEDWGPLGPIQTKMALHVGQAKMHSGGGYVSIALGILEPMEKFAQSGEIILSQAMADAVRAHLPKKIQLVDLGEQVLTKRDPAAHLFQLVLSEIT
jgi:class 3 adenylate cyclase